MPFDSYSPRILRRQTSFAMLLAGAVVLALLVPTPQRALAKEEVFFDPDSPAGKEYALPLDQARDEAAGVGKSDGPAGEKAPLFGEGVSRGGSGPGPGSSGGSTDGAPGADRAGATTGGGGRERGRGSQPLQAAISSADGHYALSSAILWVAAIIALGGIAGLVLRAVQRPRPT
ncbi:MAG TPA: hypothetical protein VN752_01585 [Solirubrobacterales bacterium]|nr:hypothetical protein [Solirubrobacterales bacterium]